MKNTFFKLIGVFAFAVVFTSCSEDKVVYNVDGGQSLAGFNENNLSLDVFNAEDLATQNGYDNSVTVTVGSTVRSNVDRTYVVTVNEEFTTADATQFSTQSTFTIPAGEFTGTLKVTGFYDALPADWSSRVLVYDLVSLQGPESQIFNPEKIQAVISIQRGCIQRPAENYTGYISSSVGSSAAPFAVKLTAVPGVFNTWSTPNLWGDLVAAATQDPSYAGQLPYPAQLKINCDNTVYTYGTADYGTTNTTPAGSYNPTSKDIRVNFTNGLFSSGFVTTVDLYAN
jgi:hypothetical protein